MQALVALALFSVRHWSGYLQFVLRAGSVVAMSIAALRFIERTGHVSILPF